LKLAQESGLDLIEFAPNAKPPVAKVISFDKFRYQKEKELKKQRAGQKSQTLKHVRISVRAAMNDLQVKVRKTDELLEKGHAVEIQLILRGREKGNKDRAREKLKEFLTYINPQHKVISAIKFGGRGPATTITLDSHGKEKRNEKNKDNEPRKADAPKDGNQPL